MELREMGARAREAAYALGMADSETRRCALRAMADALLRGEDALLDANRVEVAAARERGTNEGFIDRLTLTPPRIADMANQLREVAQLPDPLAIEEAPWMRNGMELRRVRVPLGVIGIIFESRPNVTADSAGLCVFTGNVCILRGGSEAIHTNGVIASLLREALRETGLPEDCVQLLDDPSRETAREMMRLNGLIDVLIPRGGAGLIQTVVQHATVPVIETGSGVCHTYVDALCTDFSMARSIAINAKCQRPSVCNSMETLLVDTAIAEAFLPQCLDELRAKGVEIRGCARTLALAPWAIPAVEEDWATEYNDMILSVKIVGGLDEAIAHIHTYGTRHSECIVTQDKARADKFLSRVDAAAVYHNASTRFTDGNVFGFGAEIGISNQKLHARGPMGPEQITTHKYTIRGSGQLR